MAKKRRFKTFRGAFEDRTIPEPNSGCLLWLGATDSNGYARVRRKEKSGTGHRLAYLTFVGDIPAGMHVRHKCDTPLCVNPDHLLLGTHAENMADKMARGRHCHGDNHGRAKISSMMVSEIRIRFSQGEPIASIARGLGVSWHTAYYAAHHITWRHSA